MSISESRVQQVINFQEDESKLTEIPEPFLPFELTSSDLNIQDVRLVEIPPRFDGSFGNQRGNEQAFPNVSLSDRIVFDISDPQYYADFANSYFTATVEFVAKSGANLKPAHLDAPGIQACFSNYEERVANALLMHVKEHHRFAHIMRSSNCSPNYIDSVRACEIDSYDAYFNNNSDTPNLNFTVTIGAGGVTDYTGITPDGGVPTVSASSLYYPERGDVFYSTNGNQLIFISSIDGINVTFLALENNAEPTTGNTTLTLIRRGKPRAIRSLIVNSGPLQVTWKTPYQLTNTTQLFPLPFLRDVAPYEISFTMENAHKVLRCNNLVNEANYAIGYRITNPRFIVRMVKPSQKVLNAHRAQFNGNGIIYPNVSVRHNAFSINGSSVLLQHQVNLTSVKAIFSILTRDNESENGTKNNLGFDSISSMIRGGMTQFQYRSGSYKVPDYDEAQVSTQNLSLRLAPEAFMLYMDTIQKLPTWNQGDAGIAYPLTNWSAHNALGTDSGNKFIRAANFSKDNTIFTGLPLKTASIHEAMTFDQSITNHTSHSFLLYDQMLVIHQNGILVYD